MDTLKIEKSEKLSKAVGKSLPSVSYSYLQKLLRKKDVKVNGKRISEDIVLCVGDEVVLYTSEEKKYVFVPNILFEDENILVVEKPKGIASVGENSLEEKLKIHLKSDNVFVGHRLDTNTEGLQLVARSEAVFEAFKDAFRAGEVEKKYVAVVMGKMVGKGVLKGYILKNAEESRVTIYDKPREGAVTAITEYSVIAEYEDATKLDVTIKTGRTHQIRAHLAYVDHPIIGDGKYGDYDFNTKYGEKSQVLRAYYLRINIKKGLLSYLNGKVFSLDKDFPVEKKLISVS